VPTDDCEAILFAAREKNFSREEIIFSKGDPVREVIMLLSGCVKVAIGLLLLVVWETLKH